MVAASFQAVLEAELSRSEPRNSNRWSPPPPVDVISLLGGSPRSFTRSRRPAPAPPPPKSPPADRGWSLSQRAALATFAQLGATDLHVGSSDHEVKRAFRALALQHHPDTRSTATRSDSAFIQLMSAWEKLRTGPVGTAKH